MAIAPFLAMTAAEMYSISELPAKIAWMACHFSPYGLGLSNLPRALPPGALLIVDDMTPPHGHDPQLIAEQLSACVEAFRCSGVLLDFQRSGCKETQSIAQHLAETLPCPAIVSESYAAYLTCPVFLSPLPPSAPLNAHLEPWKDREIWMELGLDGEALVLTEKGCSTTPLPYLHLKKEGFTDETLHCHYTIETNETSAGLTLWRTKDDLLELLEEAEKMGIVGAIGLYQELQNSAG